MKRCSKCGMFMVFHLDYSWGISPYVYYECRNCGYDTTRYKTYVTTDTSGLNIYLKGENDVCISDKVQ